MIADQKPANLSAARTLPTQNAGGPRWVEAELTLLSPAGVPPQLDSLIADHPSANGSRPTTCLRRPGVVVGGARESYRRVTASRLVEELV